MAEGQVNVVVFLSRVNITNIDVDGYRVYVEPEPSNTCSSTSVNVTQDHECTGLEVGMQYRYVIIPFNCQDQEGEGMIFWVHPQGTHNS